VTHRLMVMHPHYYVILEWYYTHKVHYSMRHTALWSCTHIPNIIVLSR
jgi:hypothetical protein